MKRIQQHSLLISQMLSLVVVLLTTYPILRQPRLEDDDYRYLHLIQQVEVGKIGAVESMIIENRWDHLWFLNEDGRIRFFRPTVVLSYAVDHGIWRDQVARGLTVSNVCIHLLCCWLVGYLLHQLLGRGWPALAGSLLFAGLATHSECIWYIAGRTDTLAALGFLGAFALHVAGRRWWALPVFVFGFLTKEMVIVAPLVYAAYDLWIEKRSFDWRLWCVYGVLSVGVLTFKQIALGGAGSDFVHPYLINPLSKEFFGHLGLQFRSYTGNLLAAEPTMPFADARTVSVFHRPLIPLFGALLFLVAAWILRRDRRFWLLMLMGLLTWLPTSFVYLSERYLYLPSIAYAGLVGLIAAVFPRRWQLPFALCLILYAGFHTVALQNRHTAIANRSDSLEEMFGQLQPVRSQIENADHILIVNLPGYFLRAQFAQDIFRYAYDREDLQVDVLTMMPGQSGTMWEPGDAWPAMGAGVQVIRSGDKELLLKGRVLARGQPQQTIHERAVVDFNWASLSAGGVFRTPTLEAHIVGSSPAGATELAFRFSKSLDGVVVLVWMAEGSDFGEHPWIRREKATVFAQEL